METMTFNREKLDALIIKHKEAVKNNEDAFNFEGHKLLTAYAKYLIQYLQMELTRKKDTKIG